MAEAGCRRVFVGFESIDSGSLKEMKKKESLEDIDNAVRIFHKYGIAIHGMFIFGFDTDDPGIFDRTADYCISNRKPD